MSWQDNLQDASFRGVRFDVISAQDSVARDHADHGYPWTDGEDVHDLGRRARNFRLNAVFWGDDYDDRMQQFTAELDKPGAGELIHPVYGSVPKVQLIEYQVKHDANSPDYAEVGLVFLESVTGTTSDTPAAPEQWGDSLFNRLDGLKDRAQALFTEALAPVKRVQALVSRGKTLATAMLNTLDVMRGDLSGMIRDGVSYLDSPGHYVNDLLTILDPRTLPLGQLLHRQHGAASVARYPTPTTASAPFVTFTPQGAAQSPTAGYHAPDTSSGAPEANGPAPVMSAWRESTGTLNRVAALPEAILRHEVSGSVPVPENAITTDVRELVTLHKTLVAKQAAELAAMLFLDEERVAGLSQQDLESVTNDVRGFIQSAITATRDNYREATERLSEDPQPLGLLWRPVVEDLKEAALTVQMMAEAIMATRPPLTWRTVMQDGNLHLLAHVWYQDHTRAHELLRLNPQIRDPNDIRRGDTLSAYAR
ncbi:multidrug DMT transporter permease [Salmonella enterica]|nr:multidrug DMT transporter permease [Salmonella enterica]HAD5967742.1 multidrug DMT transporter permease [Salmonella enterica subsp. enterica serovar Typhimurium]